MQRKVSRGREYFYFRTVQHGEEFRRKLPHPFDTEYRTAYDKAHYAAFGTFPGQFESQTSIRALWRDHAKSERYIRLSKNSRTLRNLALDMMVERWGAFEAADIRPVHAQALYDSLASRPATANRRADNCSAVFGWGRLRGFCDDNPFRRIERVQSEESYEPWPEEALQKLLSEGRPEIVKVALMAVYTGQRREDLLRRLTDDCITAGVWYVVQGKTKNPVPVSCVDHHGRLLTVLSRQPGHDPGEDTPVAPSFPTVVERLVRAVFPRRISPPQAIAIDEDNPAQDTPVINPGLAARLGEVRLQTRHLRIAQPQASLSPRPALLSLC